jgi:hypothetical protein
VVSRWTLAIPFFVTLLNVPVSATAAVVVDGIVPEHPIANQPVYVRVSLGPYDFELLFSTERSGTDVFCYLPLNDVYEPPKGFRTIDYPIGSFAPGTYTVEFYIVPMSPVLIDTRSMVVAPPSVPASDPRALSILALLLAAGGCTLGACQLRERKQRLSR